MEDTKVKEQLEQQLALLSERSREEGLTAGELFDLSMAMSAISRELNRRSTESGEKKTAPGAAATAEEAAYLEERRKAFDEIEKHMGEKPFDERLLESLE